MVHVCRLWLVWCYPTQLGLLVGYAMNRHLNLPRCLEIVHLRGVFAIILWGALSDISEGARSTRGATETLLTRIVKQASVRKH